MNKKELTEYDICTKFINPALQKAGWDIKRLIRKEVSFINGRIIVQGKLYTRGQREQADYSLYRRVVESKVDSSMPYYYDLEKETHQTTQEVWTRSCLREVFFSTERTKADEGERQEDDLVEINRIE